MFGILLGLLGLGLLDAATSSSAAADRAGGLIGAVATTVQHIVDPTIPAIPDLTAGGASKNKSGGGGLLNDLGGLASTVGGLALVDQPTGAPLTSTKAPAPKPIVTTLV